MKTTDENTIYISDNFIVFVPFRPHVSREDGGHIVIKHKTKHYKNRLELSPTEAIEAMRLTMLISEAMINGMKIQGIDIGRVNYQDNGNWAFLRNEDPVFHIHMYGRTIDSKNQKWGEALYFPDPSNNKFYDNNKMITTDDIKEIKNQISILEKQDRYKIENWK